MQHRTVDYSPVVQTVAQQLFQRRELEETDLWEALAKHIPGWEDDEIDYYYCRSLQPSRQLVAHWH